MRVLNFRNVLLVVFLVLVVVACKKYNNYQKVLNTQNNDNVMRNEANYAQPTAREVYNQSSLSYNTEIEQEAFDKDYIYFNGMENVYSILKYKEVEDLKVKLTLYIKNKINSNEKDASVTVLDNEQSILKLGLKVSNKNLKVIIPKDSPSGFTIVE